MLINIRLFNNIIFKYGNKYKSFKYEKNIYKIKSDLNSNISQYSTCVIWSYEKYFTVNILA